MSVNLSRPGKRIVIASNALGNRKTLAASQFLVVGSIPNLSGAVGLLARMWSEAGAGDRVVANIRVRPAMVPGADAWRSGFFAEGVAWAPTTGWATPNTHTLTISALTRAAAATFVEGSAVATGSSFLTSWHWRVGMPVAAGSATTGIYTQAGAKVAAVTETAVTLDKPAIKSGTATLTLDATGFAPNDASLYYVPFPAGWPFDHANLITVTAAGGAVDTTNVCIEVWPLWGAGVDAAPFALPDGW